MLSYLNEIKVVSTEGELVNALKINSETANKWLELFLLIKKNCPDFNYKKLGRFRIIDMVDLGGLAQEISQVELKKVTGTRYRKTRYEVLNRIYQEIKKIARALIHKLRFDEQVKWSKLIIDSHKAFNDILDENINQLAGSKKIEEDFQLFKSSLTSSINIFIQSIKNVEKDKAPAPKLKLVKIERDFDQKILHIFQEYEKAELKAGRKPDYLVLDKEKLPKSTRSSLRSELKVKLDNLPNVLEKIDKSKLTRQHETHELVPFLKCFSCNIEQKFPIHCTQRMDYTDGNLVCEICKERISIPICSKCNQIFGITVKELKKD
jgi:hypothetical protein